MSLTACTVQSRPAPAGPAGPSERRDDRGDRAFDRNSQWDKLGERWVNGRVDRDMIAVQRRERYSKIKIVVEHSALELHDIVIHFGNGEVFSPGARLIFGEGSTSREIDLPGGLRHIERIELVSGNLPGGGRAQVEVWGLGGRST
ncbi:MAG: hypothetical protein H0T65_19325 [Deltaproteobacteria bacterium]|nr:hypothetical protein [Deltaproteobacteria bacterium]